MVVNFIAGGMFAVGSSLIGMAARRHYRQRLEIYSELCAFINLLKSEISFLKTPVGGVIDEFCQGKNGVFHAALKKYNEDLKKGAPQNQCAENLELSPLKTGEKKEISKFLCSLGKLPQKEQLNELECYGAKFSVLQKKSEEECKRLGGMYLKLCVLLGLALMIIVL
jgi:stage III sporulation protein AB